MIFTDFLQNEACTPAYRFQCAGQYFRINLQIARAEPEDEDQQADDEDADEHQAVELERGAFEQQDRREELFDRRAVEAAFVIARGGVGDLGCDVDKQWRLRLRGTDDGRCDDGS